MKLGEAKENYGKAKQNYGKAKENYGKATALSFKNKIATKAPLPDSV